MTGLDLVKQELATNAEQWEAFMATGHCVALAGPGSGKTKVLTARLADLLANNVQAPRGVACVTYSNECTREIERRMRTIGALVPVHSFLGTLHSFCLRHVVRPYARLMGFNVPESITVASEKVSKKLLSDAVEEVGYPQDRDFETAFARFRRTQIDRVSGQGGWEVGDKSLTDVCLAYERALEGRELIDFDGIVLLAARIIQSSQTVRRCLSARFPYLLVDEYQDLGAALHRIVLALCFESGSTLFAVGDPDQSIYGFIGARPELLEMLSRRKDVQSVRLRVNYRSGPALVAASELALGQPRGYRSHHASGGRVAFRCCPDGIGEQASYLISTLLPSFWSAGDQPGDVAVLFPTFQEGDAVEAGLLVAGVPFSRLDSKGGYRRTPFIVLVEDCAAWSSGGWRRREPRLRDLLRRWREGLALLPPERLAGAVTRMVRFLLSSRDTTGRAHPWLARLRAGVLEPDLDGLSQDDRDALVELDEALADGGRLGDMEVHDLGGRGGSRDRLCLMNLHISKGTEFNAVVLVGMDAGRMPAYRPRPTLDHLAEQRRLFYVGLSRARREVHILYSGWTRSGRYRFDNGPSPFVEELQGALAAGPKGTK